MRRTDYKPIHFLGTDEEDLKVVSAYLQDTLVQVQNVAWQPQQRRFALVGNRFCWELMRNNNKDKGPYFRVQTGFHFDDIVTAKSQNINLSTQEAVFSILSLGCETTAGEGDGRLISIQCSGGAIIALNAEAINLTLRDLSDPWPTQSRPDHATTL